MNLQTTLVIFASFLSEFEKLSNAIHIRQPNSKSISRPLLIKEKMDFSMQQESCSHNIPLLLRLAEKIVHCTFPQNPSDSDSPNVYPLKSVFTHLNGTHAGQYLPFVREIESLVLPSDTPQDDYSSCFIDVIEKINDASQNMEISSRWISPFIDLFQAKTSFLPSANHSEYSDDISFFDYAKMVCAIASCLSETISSVNSPEQNIDADQFDMSNPYFILYSADFSGIQDFIYTVATEGALRSLRSRSFFLELFMEHYIDQILNGCGVSRANLLYSGGGHCYMLLPNTPKSADTITAYNMRFNNWLTKQFGIRLFLAHGWTPCCANELTNTPSNDTPYRKMFQRVSSKISLHKMTRYTAEQLKALNRASVTSAGRECVVCGHINRSIDSHCSWCQRFLKFSHKIVDQASNYFVAYKNDPGCFDFDLPALQGDSYYIIRSRNELSSASDSPEISHIYSENEECFSFPNIHHFYTCNYVFNHNMDVLSSSSEGIVRNAVCRMDVDNLGHAFVSGYEQSQPASNCSSMQYVTLVRTAAFSRQMSLFFKCYMNSILKKPKKDNSNYAVSVVYSGGDDVFLVGAWNDILSVAVNIRNQFHQFTCGALSISAGIGIYPPRYPIRLSASDTEEIEEQSKLIPAKNRITLFCPSEDFAYDWTEFQNNVQNEKLDLLQKFFASSEERGKAMLYHLLDLLRSVPAGKINLARIAYTLSRLEPSNNHPNYPNYKKFSENIYNWSLNPKSRKELITAIYVFAYYDRKEKS